MRRKSIVLIGAGGHAKSCIGVIESSTRYKIHGLIGLQAEIGKNVLGYEVIGDDSFLSEVIDECDYALVAVGQVESPVDRIRLRSLVVKHGLKIPMIVSNSAHISKHVTISEGVIVMPGAILMPGSSIGENCIINSRALIEHDVQIGDNCHVSTGAIINGGTVVGDNSFVGSGAVLFEGLNVGAGSLIGAGLTVRRDVSPNAKITQ